MKILFICPILPTPPFGGADLRSFKLLKKLSETDEVHLIGYIFEGQREADFLPIRENCSRLFLVRMGRRSKWAMLKHALMGEPIFSRYRMTEDFQNKLQELTASIDYRLVIIEHSTNAGLIKHLHPDCSAKIILSMHNTAYIQYRRMCRYEKNLLTKLKYLQTWLAMRNWEPRLAAMFDKIISVSDLDRKFLLERRPDLDISVVPNGVDTNGLKPLPHEARGKNILFVGAMDYSPNADAILCLCNKIFPIVRKKIRNCTVTIVGKNPVPEILRLNERPGISVHANAETLAPYYRQASVCCVPLRSGGGTRLKILEAMAHGIPVVSSPVGCEGLNAIDGSNILLANDPPTFAQRTVDVMNDPGLWGQISNGGLRLVAQNYDWDSITDQYRKIIKDLARENLQEKRGVGLEPSCASSRSGQA